MPIAAEIPKDTQDLIADCWNDSPKIRPSFAEILERLTVTNLISPNSSKHRPGAPKSASIQVATGTMFWKRPKTSKKMLLLILVVVLIVLVAGGIGLYVSLSSNKSSSTTPTLETSNIPATTSPPSSPTSRPTLKFPALCVANAEPEELQTNCSTTNPILSNYAGTGVAGRQDGSIDVAATFTKPNGIAFHPDGSLIVGNHRGLRNISGGLVRTILQFDSNPFPTSCGISQFSIDKNGDIYAPLYYDINCPNSFMFLLNATTQNATIFAGSATSGFADSSDDLTAARFYNIKQTLIHKGEIYVVQKMTNSAKSCVRVINTCPGDPNYGTRMMINYLPDDANAIAFDSRGDACKFTLTIDISSNACIVKISDGNVNLCFAGTRGLTGSSDGPPGIGTLKDAHGLAFDKCGNLFVADKGNE